MVLQHGTLEKKDEEGIYFAWFLQDWLCISKTYLMSIPQFSLWQNSYAGVWHSQYSRILSGCCVRALPMALGCMPTKRFRKCGDLRCARCLSVSFRLRRGRVNEKDHVRHGDRDYPNGHFFGLRGEGWASWKSFMASFGFRVLPGSWGVRLLRERAGGMQLSLWVSNH